MKRITIWAIMLFQVVAAIADPGVILKSGSRIVINTAGKALSSRTKCSVKTEISHSKNGIIIQYHISNPSKNPEALPTFQVPGIMFPDSGISLLDNWKVIKWMPPLKPNSPSSKKRLHPMRSYPWQSYSPVLGIKDDRTMVGAALIYDVFGLMCEVHTNYRYDKRNKSWTFIFKPVLRIVKNKQGKRNWAPAMLAPGELTTFNLSLAAENAGDWLKTFVEYRNYFRKYFGGQRFYRKSNDPIFAYSISSGPLKKQLTKENPRAFNLSLKIHEKGWKDFPEIVKKTGYDKGFRRMMIWGSVGRQTKHPKTNMAWEIGSGWIEPQKNTENEFKKLSRMGMTVGLWWGRAFAISGGFDSGHRHPWNPDNPKDNAAAFKELDAAYKRGVRLIGCDAVTSYILGKDWTPSSKVSFMNIYPLLHERYPNMKFIVEPAACDFLHLQGPSFMWDSNVNGPFEFADYLVSGAETNVAMKRRYMANEKCDWQKRFDQLRKWGYTPIVFSDSQGKNLTVKR